MGARRLATIAKWINENVPEWEAVIKESFSSTDRRISGSRLITPGKGRRGNEIQIYDRQLREKEKKQKARDIKKACKLSERKDPPWQRIHAMRTRWSYVDPGKIFWHDSSETYRTNSEVEEWVRDALTLLKSRRPKGCKRYIASKYNLRDCQGCGEQHKWPRNRQRDIKYADTGWKGES